MSNGERIPTADKERLVCSNECYMDFFILSDALGISRRTAYSIIRRYLRDGVIDRGYGGTL